MAWIESHQSLRDHPKTMALAAELKADRVKVIGHLHCLWWWSLDIVAADGLLPARCTPAVIAQAAMWKGKADNFFWALVSSGFIDDDEGSFRFHDWFDYAGRLTETRRARSEAGRAGGLRSGQTRGSKNEANENFASSKTEANPKQNEAPTNQPPQPHQPTNQPNRTVPLRSRLDLSPSDVEGLRSQFPGADINGRWKEWVSWIEEEEGERFPKDKLSAFAGWLKKRSEASYVRPSSPLPFLREVAAP